MMKHIVLSLLFVSFLALHCSAQSILKDGKIPKDLVIVLRLSSRIQFSQRYECKMTFNGKVSCQDYSTNLPTGRSFSELIGLKPGKYKPQKPKTPKLKDKISKKQIKELIAAFEDSGFFEMNDYYEGDPTLTEGTCVNHADTKGLSILTNGRIKIVAFFLGCSYGEKSPLKRFLSLYDKVDKQMQGVKKTQNQPIKSVN